MSKFPILDDLKVKVSPNELLLQISGRICLKNEKNDYLRWLAAKFEKKGIFWSFPLPRPKFSLGRGTVHKLSFFPICASWVCRIKYFLTISRPFRVELFPTTPPLSSGYFISYLQFITLHYL